MHKVEPKVFLVGETAKVDDGICAFYRHIGLKGTADEPWPKCGHYHDSYWPECGHDQDSENIIELMGRLCYKSFEVGMNPNVTKITEGTDKYIANIIKQKHGSVLEHSSVNFIFADVSRVFTHELVRHRSGVAISQESLRYVRLEDLGQWLPTVIKEDEKAVEIFGKTFEHLESLQKELAEHFKLDDPDANFVKKKVITSAMRRIAPLGLATNIGWTANMRTLRWVLEMRTHPSAEEEIRVVFGKVGEIVKRRYPYIFDDFEVVMEDGLAWYKPEHSKI